MNSYMLLVGLEEVVMACGRSYAALQQLLPSLRVINLRWKDVMRTPNCNSLQWMNNSSWAWWKKLAHNHLHLGMIDENHRKTKWSWMNYNYFYLFYIKATMGRPTARAQESSCNRIAKDCFLPCHAWSRDMGKTLSRLQSRAGYASCNCNWAGMMTTKIKANLKIKTTPKSFAWSNFKP
jgi:hypothetical protein